MERKQNYNWIDEAFERGYSDEEVSFFIKMGIIEKRKKWAAELSRSQNNTSRDYYKNYLSNLDTCLKLLENGKLDSYISMIS